MDQAPRSFKDSNKLNLPTRDPGRAWYWGKDRGVIRTLTTTTLRKSHCGNMAERDQAGRNRQTTSLPPRTKAANKLNDDIKPADHPKKLRLFCRLHFFAAYDTINLHRQLCLRKSQWTKIRNQLRALAAAGVITQSIAERGMGRDARSRECSQVSAEAWTRSDTVFSSPYSKRWTPC